MNWVCASCGLPVQETPRIQCAHCGETARNTALTISVQAPSQASMSGKAYGLKQNGAKLRIAELFVGSAFWKTAGQWVQKFQMINRRDNRYIEYITDETGNVIRDCDEPLSEHRGRGSARRDQ